MRGPLTVVLASCLSFLLLGSGFSGEAHAQRKNVVVEMMKGPMAPRLRIVVQKSLARGGFTIVPDKKLAAIEADLGLIKVSDSYSAVAREVKATAFVAGIMVGGRRPKARVVVRNADGKIIGAQGWQATSLPKLLAAVNATATPKLSAIINGAGGGGAGAGRAPVAAARSDNEDVLAAAEKTVAKQEAEEAAPAEEAAEEESPRKRKGKGDEEAEGDADAEVAEEAEAPSKKSKTAATPGTGLNVAFVLRMFSRNFAYNESIKGGQQGYQAPEKRFNNLPLVPAPGLALEYFPARIAGVYANFNYGIAGSKDMGGSVYKTSVYSWMIGGKGRIALGSMDLEPSVGYGSHVFKVDDFATGANGIQVAGVDYKHVRAGGGVSLPVSFGRFLAGGHYLHILSAGDILSDKYFQGNAVGGEVFAGAIIPLSFMKNLDFRAGLDFRRIAFAFTPGGPMADRLAGGAIDQYIGLNLGVGYQLGGS
jgi:hypothetical protein